MPNTRYAVLLLTALFLVPELPGAQENQSVPAGTNLIFEDNYFYPYWSGADVNQGDDFDLSGRVLTAQDFGDTVRFEDGELHGFENTGDTEFEYISVTAPPANFRAAYASDWSKTKTP